MSKPTSVAALIPVHNVSPLYLEQSIQSMLLQTVPLDQIIVVDDSGVGLHKKTVENVFSKVQSGQELIYLNNEANLGVIESLNRGLAVCESDLVVRMDADDISLPFRIETQKNEIMKGYDIVGGAIIKSSGEETILVQYPFNRLMMYIAFLRSNPFAHPAVMYRRKSILSVGGYKKYQHIEDFELWVRCLEKNLRMTNLRIPVLWYRIHVNQISSKHLVQQRIASRKMAARVLRAIIKNLF